MVEILEKYGGWPVVKGNDWQFDDWNWLEMSKELSSDGLPELIFQLYITSDLKNSSKRILTVSENRSRKLTTLMIYSIKSVIRLINRISVWRENFY